VLPVALLLPKLLALFAGIFVGVVVFGMAIRLTGCLEYEDVVRVREATRRLPPTARSIINGVIYVLVQDQRRHALTPVQTV